MGMVVGLGAEKTGHTDLDKAWHGLHFLLTQSAWGGDGPLAFLVNGGEADEEADMGYGPARTFSKAETQAIAKALDAIDVATLEKRFDPAKMAAEEIYPSIWDEGEGALEYVISYFEVARDFVRRAAKAGDTLTVMMC